MSASLVGSEMCIRDRARRQYRDKRRWIIQLVEKHDVVALQETHGDVGHIINEIQKRTRSLAHM
eukprot:196179-Alexandrium_andersonii.AAC.1